MVPQLKPPFVAHVTHPELEAEQLLVGRPAHTLQLLAGAMGPRRGCTLPGHTEATSSNK